MGAKIEHTKDKTLINFNQIEELLNYSQSFLLSKNIQKWYNYLNFSN